MTIKIQSKVVQNLIFHTRTKYVRNSIHFYLEEINQKKKINNITINKKSIDILIKPLQRIKFKIHIKALGL